MKLTVHVEAQVVNVSNARAAYMRVFVVFFAKKCIIDKHETNNKEAGARGCRRPSVAVLVVRRVLNRATHAIFTVFLLILARETNFTKRVSYKILPLPIWR